MPSPNNVLTADSYIQDGLVFQLDGIEYGGIDGQWIEKKSSKAFIASHAGMYVDNHFQFSNGKFLATTSLISFPASYYIQIAATNISGNGAIIYLGNNMFVYNLGSEGLFLQTNNIQKSTHFGLIAKLPEYLIVNGFKFSNIVSQRNNPSVNYSYIGRLNQYNVNFLYSASIYAIRVYSRQLSDREILINQKIDNARFDLGLNIPDEVLPANRSLSLSEPFELEDESMTEQDITNETSDER